MAFARHTSTPATMAEAVFNLKTHLKAQGWTVPSSSDGLTYNASGDQITVAGSGAGGMANNSAWFRLRDPAGLIELLFQRGTTNLVWRVMRSKVSRFTGGSPGITQTPSAADEQLIRGGGSHAAPTFITCFPADGGTSRLQIMADNAAPYGWWLGMYPNGGGVASTLVIFDPLEGPVTDSDPYIFSWSNSTTGGQIGNITTGSGLSEESGALATSYGNWGHVASAGVGVFTHFSAMGLFAVSSGSVVASTPGMGTNPVSGLDESFPLMYGRRAALANPGFKGVSTLAKLLGTQRSNGDTFTLNTTRDRIVIGMISLVWDGSVPTV